MSEGHGFPVKKAILYALIGSVGLSAFLGIIALLSGRFGQFEIRILLTTITIAVASISGLACGAYLATKRGQVLPLVGMALTLWAAVMIIAGIWIEEGSDDYWKFAASVSVFSVACAHLSLLSMARLAKRFQWSLAAAYVAIFGVASLLVLIIFHETDDVGMFRLLGVAAILDAAITILIPIFHRLSKDEVAVGGEGPGAPVPGDVEAEIAKLRERIMALERLKQQGR